jgi:hypothetical protein
MHTPSPATRPAFPCHKILTHNFYSALSRFLFFRGSDPAKPLIPREWCNVLPHLAHIGSGGKYAAEVCWDSVNNTCTNMYFAHYENYTKETLSSSVRSSVRGIYLTKKAKIASLSKDTFTTKGKTP